MTDLKVELKSFVITSTSCSSHQCRDNYMYSYMLGWAIVRLAILYIAEQLEVCGEPDIHLNQ